MNYLRLLHPGRRLIVAQNEASFSFKIQWRAYFRSRFNIRETNPYIRHSFSSSTSSKSRTGFVGCYLKKLETRPFITKSITSSLIYAASDFTSQGWLFSRLSIKVEVFFYHIRPRKSNTFYKFVIMITMPSSGSFDLLRTTRMAAYGLMILGPSQHLWFGYMSRILPKRDVLTTFKKIFLGQAVYGPIITTVFFSYNASLQGETGSEIVARLKRDLLPTLTNGVLFWPVCDFFTYKFVPVHLQPLMNSSCAYIWTIYLTYMASLQGVELTSTD